MAEKISTLILKVDLDCELCYKKIRKVLCKLQDKEKINAISYDEKNKTVTISGPFDPQKLSKKLQCRAGKVIKEIQIKDNKEKEKEKEKEKDAEKDKGKDKAAEKEKPKETKPAKEDKPKDKQTEPAEQKPKDKPAESGEQKPKPAEKEPSKEMQAQPKSEPGPPIQAWPAGPPPCCYRPFYEGYYGGCRCCTCGRAYGWMGSGPMGFYGGGPYDGYKSGPFFCEEDPSSSSCHIM